MHYKDVAEGKILIIDDDLNLLKSFKKVLSAEGYSVLTVSSGKKGIESIQSKLPDLVLLEIRLPDMNGLEVYKCIRKLAPELPTIIMTAFGSTDTAIKASNMGAFEYVLKPFKIHEMLNLVEQALAANKLLHSRQGVPFGLEMYPDSTIVGQSRVMLELYKAIGRVAATNVTVLIRGESGTGKDLIARAIHRYSKREGKLFQVIDCVSIPENLLESELFGYEKGAFTGAAGRHAGKIEIARGGTVFLDEIGDMPLSIQAKILRLLQEKKIQHLGGNKMFPADVRIIAATNRDLEKALAQKLFREDLYYRLKVVTLWAPPVRERREDIKLLSQYFLDLYAGEFGISNPGIDDDALRALSNYEWPGNVRELSNVIQKALLFSRGCCISSRFITQAIYDETDVSDLGKERMQDGSVSWIHNRFKAGDNQNMYAHLMDHFSRQIVNEALAMANGNRTRAAKLLGISRQALVAKIAKFSS